jgi:hypothetical protein
MATGEANDPLEKFFAEVGREVTNRSVAPPMTPADIEKLLAVAPKYGMEIDTGR